MAESKLRELSMDFSVDIINLVKFLKSNHESDQALRDCARNPIRFRREAVGKRLA